MTGTPGGTASPVTSSWPGTRALLKPVAGRLRGLSQLIGRNLVIAVGCGRVRDHTRPQSWTCRPGDAKRGLPSCGSRPFALFKDGGGGGI